MLKFALIPVMLILAFTPVSETIYLKGHISPGDPAVDVVGLIIIVKEGDKVLGKTFTGPKGDFNLVFNPEHKGAVDFFCTGIGIDTMLLASMKTFESDTPEITFQAPIKYKRNGVGKVICPKCEKTTRVYKMVYGLRKQPLGITGNKYYTRSCVVWPSKYYCDRDKVKF